MPLFPSLSRFGKSRPRATILEEVGHRLAEFNRVSEQDFLEVGPRLMEIHSASAQLVSLSGTVADHMTGERGKKLEAALEPLHAVASRMEERAGSGESAFQQMEQEALTCRAAAERIERFVTLFHVLGMQARVETARLAAGDQDWEFLADQVRSLADGIQHEIMRIIEAIGTLAGMVAAGRASVAQSEDSKVRHLQAAIAGVMEQSQAFQRRRQAAADGWVRIGATSQQISEAVASVVTAVQFHDITRQQLEHIVTALEEALRAGGLSATGAVVLLQANQLRAARSSFLNSVDSIRSNLRDIGSRITSMAGETSELSGASRSECDSFFVGMEKGYNQALAAIGASLNEEREIGHIAQSLDPALAITAQCIEELRNISLSIQRLGLNAAIRSAHFRTGGEPLGVLAAAIQDLSERTAVESETLAAAFAKVGATAQSLAGQLEEGQTADQVANLPDIVLALRDCVGLTSTQLQQIDVLAESTSSALSAAEQRFQPGGRFAAVVDEAIAQLEAFAATCGTISAADVGRAAGRYTMHSEREVHERFMENSSAEPEALAPPEEDLGANVELF